MKINKGLLKKMIAEEMAKFNTMSEQEEEQGQEQSQEQPQEEGGGGLVDINAGPEEVLKKVPQMLKDPKLKAILGAGQTDGDPGDDAIQIRTATRTAKDLTPTQSQIGAGQSLDDQASDEDFGKGGTTNLDRAIAGGRLASQTGLFPILVYKNYVLDGHHRWSQFMATNPNATVDVAEIIAPGVKDEEGALALLHYMNFALFGQSPTKDFKGANIYGMDANALYQQALSKITDSTVAKLSKAGLIDQTTPEAAAKHFAKNLAALIAKGPGSKPRLVMPQPGDAGSKDGYATSPEAATSGKVNYINPKQSDVKEAKKDLLKRIVAEEIAKMEIEAIQNEGFFSRLAARFGRANKDFPKIFGEFKTVLDDAAEKMNYGRLSSSGLQNTVEEVYDAYDKYTDGMMKASGADNFGWTNELNKDQQEQHDEQVGRMRRIIQKLYKKAEEQGNKEAADKARELERQRRRDAEEEREARRRERERSSSSSSSSSSRKSEFDKWYSDEGDNYNYMTRMESLSKQKLAKVVQEVLADMKK